MTLATRLTRRFDIQHPILCAPMGMITGGKLAGAVSSAGGLGILGGGYAGTVGNEPDLDEQYRAAGNVPIGIGFITWAAQKAPQMVDWNSMGDGSMFGPQAANGKQVKDVWPDQAKVQQAYGDERIVAVLLSQQLIGRKVWTK